VSNQLPVVIQAQSTREVAYLRLKQLLHLPYEQPLALTTSVEDSTAAPPGVDLARAQSPDTLTSHRAPVREAGEAVTAQKGQLKVARSERIPTLAVSTAYSRVAYPSSGLPSLADFHPNWTVTLSTSFPIFLGGRIRGDQLVAESNVRDAQARLEQAREGAALDSRVALNTLSQAQATLAASVGTASQAQRAYQIAEVRFREGISTQLELNDTRNQLAQALVNRAQASRDVQVARVRLALLPDLPVQTATAGQTNLSQQQQQQQQLQIQQQTPAQTQQPAGSAGQTTPSTGGATPTGPSGNNQ
jgi:outer membrane protein